MDIEITLRREPNSKRTANRLYVYSGVGSVKSIVQDFPDTPDGMEEAKKCYNDTLASIRKTGQIGETLLKEIVSVDKKESE